MKTVLLVNGSPREAGCTRTALEEVAGALERHGLATRIFNLGTGPVHGCTACGACTELKRCILEDDVCNELLGLMQQADAVIGSPVYYAGPNGALCAVLDRVFFASQEAAHKPAAAVVNCRRGGERRLRPAEQVNPAISRMPVVSSHAGLDARLHAGRPPGRRGPADHAHPGRQRLAAAEPRRPAWSPQHRSPGPPPTSSAEPIRCRP